MDSQCQSPPPPCTTACQEYTGTYEPGDTENAFHGWYDVQGCGKCNDYCRWVEGTGSGGNPAPVIFPNGSLLGLWRGGLNSTRPWSTIQRVTATNWKDPSTYKPEYDDLFPDVHSAE